MEKPQTQIQFIFYPTPKEGVEVKGNPKSTLGDVIAAAGGRLKNLQFRDEVLFAELSGFPEEVAVLPDILCAEIKQGGKVRMKINAEATSLSRSDKEAPKKQTLFFIKSNKLGITKIPSSEYEGKLLCVIAYGEDTLEDAIYNDGRFSNKFMLLEDNDRQCHVPLHQAASNFPRTVFTTKRKSEKRKLEDQSSPDEDNLILFPEVRPSRRRVRSRTGHLAVYSSIPSNIKEPFTEEIRKSMVDDARKNAKKTLIESGREEDTDKYIRDVIQNFGKKEPAAVPTRILPALSKARESIGFINCGTVSGTCFLLTKLVIITCQHIFNEIESKRSKATDLELYREIRVNFGYEYPHQQQAGNCMAVVDESKTPIIGEDLDYIIHFLKPTEAINNLEGLGYMIRSPVPQDGLVTLIGHPESREKVFEACRIIANHNWHDTLCSRVSEAEHHCEQHPDECQINAGTNVQCVHIHKGRYYQGDHPNDLPYDTSFFHGASGSPVFNADGHIIAMHTQGYPYYKSEVKISLMEFGVVFQAIYEDVKGKFHGEDRDKVVRMLFPGLLIT